ncbi:HAD-IB family hydrolase [Xylophilus rhododendri]|uniref:HAD-IB family hydrolase n=1 Tax=Xylophilus rhododendri TaxID=2697032 RepID=A0A857JE81_9BURK|nr:HAD family hydrolase [Xylophilus rhododendri]QHJ01089.1 HAD-IB family hydrolase [Xylophilus rhododendri]
MSCLAVFDLDNTLLTGDSEVLWVRYLLDQGLLPGTLAERNADMDLRYHAGKATPAEFCAFYASTFGGRTPEQWAPVLPGFVQTIVRPRIAPGAHALVERHRARGDLLVLSTASSRFLSEPTAALLGFEHLIATEMEIAPDGRFTGRNQGTLNMREGKVLRLRHWLGERGMDADETMEAAVFYSDSINDLPLLAAVGRPVAVTPDARLETQARIRGWQVLPTLAVEPSPLS